MTAVKPEEVVLGEISGVFGIRGELRIFLHYRESETLRTERSVIIVSPEGQRREVQMVVRPGAGKRILAKIRGVETPEDAALLNGWEIRIRRADLPPAGDGEFYVQDLIGLPVEDETGTHVGTLAEVVPGAKDIWVVEPPEEEGQPTGDPIFVLAEPGNILKVDVPGRKIVIDSGALSGAL